MNRPLSSIRLWVALAGLAPVSPGGWAQEPAAPPAASPPIVSSRDLTLRFRIAERGAAEIAAYTVHYTLDGGQSWTSIDHQRPASARIPFHAPADGRYGFSLSAVDEVGARSPVPASGDRPALELAVDTTPPAIRVIRPVALEPVATDARVEIEWEVRDEHLGPSPLEVSASLDGGPFEPFWRDLPPAGRRFWNVPLLPGEVRLRFRARDLAGNSAETVTPAVYRVEPGYSAGARWVAVSPHSRSRRVPVFYRVARSGEKDSQALSPEELRKVEVWYRCHGLEWIRGDPDPDRRSPLVFTALSDGWYELLVTAVDRNGRWLPQETLPRPDGRPDHNLSPHARLLVDTLEPRVRIASPGEGEWIDGGAPLSIRYVVEEENPGRHAVTISCSVDGASTWSVLAEGLEPEPSGDGRGFRGEFRFNLPSVQSESFLLKVEARDAAGNAGEASTGVAGAITIRNPREDPGLKAEEHYRRGVVQSSSPDPGERRRAMESFRRAIAYKSEHAAAHHDLAVSLEAAASGQGAMDAAEEALAHFRKAHAADPANPRYSFSLVTVLLRRAQTVEGERRALLHAEAESVFGRISWTRLVEMAGEDREESQRLRRQYRQWKEQHFSRPVR